MRLSKTIHKTFLFTTMASLTILLAWRGPAWGGSLIEYYNATDQTTLQKDTEKMTKKLKVMFDPKDIAQKQKAIDFSNFFSNFRNLILYASKLASYHDYQENIRFGREREIYKGLPLEGEMKEGKKAAINKKYDRLEDISKEEIETYKDMMETSFDICEIYTQRIFFGDNFFKNKEFKGCMEEYFAGKDFQDYRNKLDTFLKKASPEYVDSINRLVLLWVEPPPSPNDHIIDPGLVNAL